MRENHNSRNGPADPGWTAARPNFEAVWDQKRPTSVASAAPEPSVEELLGVDREYRAKVAAAAGGQLPHPLRLARDSRQYVVRFALPRRDGPDEHVLLAIDGAAPARLYLVVTGSGTLLKGKRVIRGREPECLAYYRSLTGPVA